MHPLAPLLRTALNTTSRIAPRLSGRLAFAAFVRPLGRSRVRPAERALLDRARLGTLRLRGRNVVTYTWGDGARPVLLVHGWSSRSSRFSAFITALCDQGYSPVTFDAPGHGDSEGRASNLRDYREIIGRLHAEHGDFEAVVAHSFGVLASFVALHDGVVAHRFVGIGGVAEFDHLLDAFRTRLGLHERVERDIRGHVERVLFPGEPAIWERLTATYRPERLPAPVLLLHDEDDDMTPVAQSRLAAAALGDRARLVLTKGLGHRRILADPDVVARAVDFVVTADARP
ncbi:alpha/beta fold hydrolase [Streptomyces sp. NPDC057116]|uniref:alpha/beta fold hydrolase n=1 Tax=Streptomyces sp. NPDC057116 TaxID=3346023 RepID=UPI0036335006